MRKLYHLWLCPFSRKVRIVMHEKALDFELKLERPWTKRQEFYDLNPAGKVPVLEDLHGMVICDSNAICEYLDEAHQTTHPSLFGRELFQRAEVRRLVGWFDGKFFNDVMRKIICEKLYKRYYGLGNPDSKRIREGNETLHVHLRYLSWLLERRSWLAGDEYSMADITAGAHLSSLDYLGHVPWERYESLKEWYVKLKSRPSFRPLLQEKIPGILPPKHYADPDF